MTDVVRNFILNRDFARVLESLGVILYVVAVLSTGWHQ
jgi:hypothetical protein